MLWIGGPPAVGKTAIATRLARRHGLRLYSADTRTWAHRDRALRQGNLAARRWESLTPEWRWQRATAAEMLEMSLHRERGQMVIDDVASLPTSPLVVAEGSTLPASAVAQGIVQRSRALWLLPTEDFHERQLAARSTTGGPLLLYRLLREVVEPEAIEHQVPSITVDGTRGVAEMVAVVEEVFADALAAGPRAETRELRRRLLREFNEAVVGQVHSYYARPWAQGDPDAVKRTFLCECGDLDCEAEVVLSVGDATAGRVLASGHS